MPDVTADFFVSYTGVDREWAEWIAWQLERADFKVVIQAWDFRPGSNFVVEMNRAATAARRTILVVSANALESDFVRSEWAAAFAHDPTGIDRKLIPVRVEDCDIEGLLGQIVYVDLVGRDGDDAVRALISGVEPGRSKPSNAPKYPGHWTGSPAATSRAPQDIQWSPLPMPPDYTKLADLKTGFSRGYVTIIEVHLIPNTPELIPVSRLSTMEDSLAAIGRAGGMFSPTSALTFASTAEYAAMRVDRRQEDNSGLLVTRTGQRGAWLALPHDGLGSVFDSQDLAIRLAGAIRILAKIDLPLADRYAPVAIAGPLSMLAVGDSSLIGRRNSASLRPTGPSEIATPLEDSVPGFALASGADNIAVELVARLAARL